MIVSLAEQFPDMKTITLIALALLFGSAFTQAANATWKFEESFSSASDGTPLDKLPGWSLHYGEGAAPVILTAAGYEGRGARFTGKASFKRELGTVPALRGDGGTLEFCFKLRVMADSDAYVMSQVMLGQSGGVSGLCVRFNGGTKDGREDNFIQVSAGGADWGKVKFQNVPDSRWRKGVWYEVIISGIRPDGAAEGDPAGKVSIKELDTDVAGDKTLIRDAPVACVGAGAFNQANVLIIGNAGSSRTFDVDDIILKTAAP